MAPDPLTRRRPARAAAVVLVATVAAVPLLGAVDLRLDTMLDTWRSCPGEALATLVSNLVGPVGVAVLVIALDEEGVDLAVEIHVLDGRIEAAVAPRIRR